MFLERKEILYKGKIIFERLVVSSNLKRVPKPFMEDEACFLYLTKGGFKYRTPTNLLILNEGEGLLSKCGNYFVESIEDNVEIESPIVSMVGAFFYPTVVKSFFQTDLSIDQFQNKFDASKINIEPLMKNFIESINYLLDNPDVADENLIINKLKELILLLSKTDKAPSINAFVNSLFSTNEYDFNEVIQNNLFANLSLPEMAHLCNMSLATFKRRFIDYYKESPAKYILQKKLEKSLPLLQIESNSISEIAYECGFESISNFDRSFKKVYAISPSQYRVTQNVIRK